MDKKRKTDFHYDYIRYEDENGNKIPKGEMPFYKGLLFKCWIVGGTRFQVLRVR